MRKKSKKSEIESQLRKKVAASLADPRKSIAATDVFKRLRAAHAKAVKEAKRGA
jgi:antitoxin ParD1/3/4